MASPFDQRPILVALAGPNGAGKTTFYHAHLKPAGLRLVNADVIAHELRTAPYDSAAIAEAIRLQLIQQRESFVFETVFSDPVGDKLAFLKAAAASGYTILLCFIGISGAEISEQRVAMRVSQGGHDVPSDKLLSRFSRILANLKAALRELPHVRVYDNDDLRDPYRLVAVTEAGSVINIHRPLPTWLKPLLPANSNDSGP